MSSPSTEMGKESKTVDTKGDSQPKGTCCAAIFFDWDDTLLSSSVLWRLGFRLDSEMDPNDTNLHKQLRELECSVISILKKASTFGKVHIVTNGETGWVQRSAEKFIPAVVPLLANVDIISARSTFEGQYPEDPLKWKVCAFESRLKAFVATSGNSQSKVDVISFGDSHVEREAIRIATKTLNDTRTKSVKFAERPSMEQLRRQIELINNCFHFIHEHDGDLDLQLTITEHTNPQQQSSQQTNNSSNSSSNNSCEDQPVASPAATPCVASAAS